MASTMLVSDKEEANVFSSVWLSIAGGSDHMFEHAVQNISKVTQKLFTKVIFREWEWRAGKREVGHRSCKLFKAPQIIPRTAKALVYYVKSSFYKSSSNMPSFRSPHSLALSYQASLLSPYIKSGSQMDIKFNPDVSNGD